MSTNPTQPGAPARVNLVAAIAAATADDYQAIRTRIGELSKEIETLRAVEKILAIRFAPKNGKAEASPAPRAEPEPEPEP